MNTLASITNLFGGDMWILLVIVLILFGAKKLPELAKGAGQAIREFNKAKDEFEREITKPAEEVRVQQPQGSMPYTPPAPVVAAAPVSAPIPASVPAPQPQHEVAQNVPAPQNAPSPSAPQV